MHALQFVLAVALLTVGCAGVPSDASRVPRPSDAEPIHSAIIFIPGFYGSALKESRTGERFFITAGNYLFGTKAVSLHTQELETPAGPDLVLDGVLEKVSLIPGIYSVDVYGSFLARLSKLAKDTHHELVPFAYDWRQDWAETAHALQLKVDELHARGINQIEIVAHSMGCLISAYYLAYGDQDPLTAQLNWFGAKQIRRVVLMAGPYGGAFSLFRNMQTGARIGGNTSYMPAETVASLPSSYDLLPVTDFHLIDESGRPVAFAVKDVEQWRRLRLGLLRNQSLNAETRQRRLEFMTVELNRASAFAAKISMAATPAPPVDLKILQLIGTGRRVVDSAYYREKDGQLFFDTDNLKKRGLDEALLFSDGDGSVTVHSAQLPVALKARAIILSTKEVHERVFDDPKFQTALGDFLR